MLINVKSIIYQSNDPNKFNIREESRAAITQINSDVLLYALASDYDLSHNELGKHLYKLRSSFHKLRSSVLPQEYNDAGIIAGATFHNECPFRTSTIIWYSENTIRTDHFPDNTSWLVGYTDYDVKLAKKYNLRYKHIEDFDNEGNALL